MREFDSTFIGDFVTGDNIVHTMKCAGALIDAQNNADEQQHSLFIKPIVFLLGSVIEAILFDLHFKAKSYTREGVKGFDAKTLKSVANSKRDKFVTFIDWAKKYEIYALSPEQYEFLHYIRELRNRMHIQISKRPSYIRDNKDDRLFDPNTQTKVQSLLELVLERSAKMYPRPEEIRENNYVGPISIPW